MSATRDGKEGYKDKRRDTVEIQRKGREQIKG